MAADTLHVRIHGRVRADLRELKGNNDNGPWSMTLCEVLDDDDNKVEIILPKQNCPDLAVDDQALFDCTVSVRRNRLSVTAHTVKVLDAKTGELRAVDQNKPPVTKSA